MVGLTDQPLSCAARAHVVTAERNAACLHLRRAMRAACRRASCAERGGSAAGPKPGRASFYGELGRSRFFADSIVKIYERRRQGALDVDVTGKRRPAELLCA